MSGLLTRPTHQKTVILVAKVLMLTCRTSHDSLSHANQVTGATGARMPPTPDTPSSIPQPSSNLAPLARPLLMLFCGIMLLALGFAFASESQAWVVYYSRAFAQAMLVGFMTMGTCLLAIRSARLLQVIFLVIMLLVMSTVVVLSRMRWIEGLGWAALETWFFGFWMAGVGIVLLLIRAKDLQLRLTLILPLVGLMFGVPLLVLNHFNMVPSEQSDVWWISWVIVYSVFSTFSLGMYFFVLERRLQKAKVIWKVVLGSILGVLLAYLLDHLSGPFLGPALSQAALTALVAFFCVGLLRTASAVVQTTLSTEGPPPEPDSDSK
jgi:hypothetical protein